MEHRVGYAHWRHRVRFLVILLTSGGFSDRPTVQCLVIDHGKLLARGAHDCGVDMTSGYRFRAVAASTLDQSAMTRFLCGRIPLRRRTIESDAPLARRNRGVKIFPHIARPPTKSSFAPPTARTFNRLDPQLILPSPNSTGRPEFSRP